MADSPKHLSVCPVLIDTKTNGFERDSVEVVEQSLEFRFFEGRETVHAFPHTTGWRVLPFSVFSCLLENSATAYVEGYPEMRLGPGDAHLIPAGVRHRDDVPGGEGVRARWLHFTFRLLGGLDLFALLESPGYIPAGEAREGSEALREIIDSYAPEPGANLLAMVARRRQAVSRFLAFLVEVCPARRNIAELIALSRRLQPVLVHIHERFAEPICRDDLARLAHLSRSRFHSLFHQVTGLGPMEYVKRRRLQAAQALLLTTDKAIKEICAAVGYGDPFHFTRLFTAAIGCSPCDFRKRNAIAPG